MRTIDADELVESLRVDPIECMGCPEPEWLGELIDVLDSAPTIEIVRCNECRWYKDFDGCFFSTAEVDKDGFCSYGERREP